VAMQDSAGNLAVVTYGDDTLVASAQWFEWSIPLSSFGGVDPARVKALHIGLGDRDNPVPGSAGLVFVDDIQVRPAAP